MSLVSWLFPPRPWLLFGALVIVGCDSYDARLLMYTDLPRDGGSDSGPIGPTPDAGGVDPVRAGTGGDSSRDAAEPNDITTDAGDRTDAASAGSGADDASIADSGDDSGALEDAGPCVADAGMDCCPNTDSKTEPGVCGCSILDADLDQDGVIDCEDPALGWRKAVTIDGTQVQAALTGFPVLVRITDSDLAARAAATGTDISFLDAAQATVLAHELESYDSATGALLAWVRVPSVAAGSDTVFYLRYGDGGPDRSDAAAVWSDHHYVWHLAQDPGPGGSGEMLDSTGRAHGTANGTMTSADLVDGVIGKGIDFDGTDDEIGFTNDFTGAGPSTFSGWIDQRIDNDGSSDTVLSFGTGEDGQTRLLYSAHTTTGNLVGGFFNNDLDSGSSIEGAGWRHVVWVWDGSNSSFYVNGALVSGPTAHAAPNTVGAAGKIGNAIWAPRFVRGQLDEVRVCSTARSAAWIAAEHANQRIGSTFIKPLGAEQAVALLPVSEE